MEAVHGACVRAGVRAVQHAIGVAVWRLQYPEMAPATASSVSAGRMAVRALLNAATPTGSESTPEPTMDLTRFAVLADRPALALVLRRRRSSNQRRRPQHRARRGEARRLGAHLQRSDAAEGEETEQTAH